MALRLEFPSDFVHLFGLDLQRFLARGQVGQPSGIVLRLRPDRFFFLRHGLFSRLDLDFAGQDCLVLFVPCGLVQFLVLRDSKLMLTDFLRLSVEVRPAAAEFVFVLGRPVLELPPLGFECPAGLFEDDPIFRQRGLPGLEVPGPVRDLLECGLGACPLLPSHFLGFMDLAFAGRELGLGGRQARLSGGELLRLRRGSCLRCLGMCDPCVDRAFEFQQLLLIDVELCPTLREILEVLAYSGLPSFQRLGLNPDSVGLGHETLPFGGEPFLFLPDALLALVQLRLDRSDRRLAFVDPVRFLDQLALAGLDLPDPRVEIRTEGLGPSCEVIDGVPVLRDLELAALQVFFLRIDRRPVGRKPAPLLLDLMVHRVQFAGSRLDPDPPLLESFRLGLQVRFLETGFFETLLDRVFELVLDLDQHFAGKLHVLEGDRAVGEEDDPKCVTTDRLAVVLGDLDRFLDRIEDARLYRLVIRDLARRVQGEFPEHFSAFVHKEGLCGPPALSLREHSYTQEDSGKDQEHVRCLPPARTGRRDDERDLHRHPHVGVRAEHREDDLAGVVDRASHEGRSVFRHREWESDGVAADGPGDGLRRFSGGMRPCVRRSRRPVAERGDRDERAPIAVRDGQG